MQDKLHPDLDHPEPVGPHWDYEGPGFETGTKLFSRWNMESEMIKKYQLDYIITKKFVENNLSKLNTLSTLILQTLSQEKGVFFTYLPKGQIKSQIHDFLSGGKTKNNRKAISEILHSYMMSKKALCILDDINVIPTELDNDFISNNNVFFTKMKFTMLLITTLLLR